MDNHRNSKNIVEMLVAGRNDLIWFESNLNDLITRYNNKFIAFSDNKVIESDPTLDNLMKKLLVGGIDTSNVFIKFISKIKQIL